MRHGVPAPPDHPRLTETRVGELWVHLAHELRRERASRPRLYRRRKVILAVAVLLLTLVGAGYAVGTRALDAFDISNGLHEPTRIGDRVEIAGVDGYSLHAWRSTRGICLGVVRDGKPAASGCGMPVVGVPPDQVFPQPEPTHVIGYMAGGADGDPFWVAGPVAESVRRVEVELVNGRILEGQVYEAPAVLHAKLGFYFLVDETLSDTTFTPDRHPVQEVRAYDAAGVLLERLRVPVPE